MSTLIAPWADDVVRGIADVLGETDGGLTGSQIGQLLQCTDASTPLPCAA